MKSSNVRRFASAAVCGLLFSGLAVAQTDAPPATPASTDPAASAPAPKPADGEVSTSPRKIFLVAEAPEPATHRRYHFHDGLYVRVDLGYGLQWGAFDPGNSSPTLDFSGNSIGVNLLVGGSPSPGVAIGGALLSSYTFTSEGGQDAFDPNIQTLVVGPFIDGFPDPAGGWHFGGTAGLASILASDDRVAESTLGIGGAAWAGFDRWVGDDWSVGGLLRFSAARTVGDGNATDTVVSSAQLGLFFTALYH